MSLYVQICTSKTTQYFVKVEKLTETDRIIGIIVTVHMKVGVC